MFQRGLLGDDDVERLAGGVMHVLECVGILYQNEEMLKALAEWGASVDMAEGEIFAPAGGRVRASIAAGYRQAGSKSAGTPPTFQGSEPAVSGNAGCPILL